MQLRLASESTKDLEDNGFFDPRQFDLSCSVNLRFAITENGKQNRTSLP